jgi:hypothetical protein
MRSFLVAAVLHCVPLMRLCGLVNVDCTFTAEHPWISLLP